MVSVLASSVVDRGFQAPVRSNPRTMKLVFATSLLSTHHLGERAKTGWLGFRIMCLSGVTRLSADCCISELAL